MAKISQSFNAPVVLACLLFCSLKEKNQTKQNKKQSPDVTQTREGERSTSRAGVPSARLCRRPAEARVCVCVWRAHAGSAGRAPGPPEEPLRVPWCRRQLALSTLLPLDTLYTSDLGLCKSTMKPQFPHLTCASLAKCHCLYF